VRLAIGRAVAGLHDLVRVVAGEILDGVEVLAVLDRVAGLVHAVAERSGIAHAQSLPA
jgi:hypothetical protein